MILLPPGRQDTLSRMLHHVQELQFVLPSKTEFSPDPAEALVQAASACNNFEGIAWYFKSISHIIEGSLPENRSGLVKRTYDGLIANFLLEFAKFAFPFLVSGVAPLAEFDQQVRAVKWTMADAVTEAHPYVATWRTAGIEFRERVGRLAIPEAKKDDLWIAFWTYTNLLLLNAFASSPKVTSQGRQAMLLDFRSLANEFPGLTVKKIPFDEKWTADYIQAFFKEMNQFKEWLQSERNKYSLTQMMTLIESGLSSDLGRQPKKDLKALLQAP
jgi:hypothetical protein